MKKCPTCGREYSAPPAISRIDNETEICPKCGINEALEAMFNHLGKGDIYEKVVNARKSEDVF